MRQLTIQRVMFITLFALIFAMATRIPVDTDTWWHLRSGEHTLTEGMIYTDPFSSTKHGESWINHSWGSQIILYGMWEVVGNTGLALYTAILATAGMAVIYHICTGNPYLRAFVLILAASTAAVFWSPRPQMTSFLLSTVLLYILYRYKRDGVDRLWFIPLLMLVWGNLHAGFTIGFILMGGVIAGEIIGRVFNPRDENVMTWPRIRKVVLVAIVSAAALVVNPYGLDMLRVPFDTVSMGMLRDYIQEWNSPNFQQRQTWPFIFMIVALIGAAGASSRRIDWTGFVLVSGTLFMALLYGRNISLFAVVAAPVLALHLDTLLQDRGWTLHPVSRVTGRQARLNLVLVIVMLFGAFAYIVYVLDAESVAEAQQEFLPVRVADYLREEAPPGPMFNSYNWGGYFMFALPEYPVYVDGRTDLYRDEFLTRYMRAALGHDDWNDILDEDGINLVVVENGSGLARALSREGDWRLVYPDESSEDEKAVVYVRESEVTSGS